MQHFLNLADHQQLPELKKIPKGTSKIHQLSGISKVLMKTIPLTLL